MIKSDTSTFSRRATTGAGLRAKLPRPATAAYTHRKTRVDWRELMDAERRAGGAAVPERVVFVMAEPRPDRKVDISPHM